MVKIDLITGFLGSGKTTFLIKYAKYLMAKGERICILENDYGPINIDMMLIAEVGCDREMVSGGCDYDCHVRRFRTKLIAMGMKGYDRVIVEPSGIYDTDEFFDVLYEDPLTNMYEIGNIFCMYDIHTKDLSYESKYILTSEASICGKLIVSKRDNNEVLDLDYINNILKEFKCIRVFSDKDVMYTDELDFDKLINSSYHSYDYIKVLSHDDNNFDSIYFTDIDYKASDIINKKEKLFDSSNGNVVRIKGFLYNDSRWTEINITKEENEIKPINDGQKVIIVIGERLNKEKIEEVLNNEV